MFLLCFPSIHRDPFPQCVLSIELIFPDVLGLGVFLSGTLQPKWVVFYLGIVLYPMKSKMISPFRGRVFSKKNILLASTTQKALLKRSTSS